MEEPIQYIQFLLCLFLFNWNSFASGSGSELDDIGDKAEFKIEGKVYFTSKDKEWTLNTKVLVDGGNYLGFVRSDGSFVVHGIPSGSYVVEVVNPDAIFETVRIEITSKGKMRARRVNFLQPSHVKTVAYPLEFRERGKPSYFHKREQWRLTDFLFNPMVLTMIVPLLLIMVLPKLMNAADVDTQKVVQEERTYGEEDNYHISVTSYPSAQHDSKLLKCSQKSLKSSTSVISDDQSDSKNSSILFKPKYRGLLVKGNKNHTKCRDVFTNTGKHTDINTSVKRTIVEHSRKRLGRSETYKNTTGHEQNVRVKKKSASRNWSNIPAENEQDGQVDLRTRLVSPSKLRSMHKYKIGESPVSRSTASTYLSLDETCSKNAAENHESDVSKEIVSNFARDQNINNETQCNQNGADNKHEHKLGQSVKVLSKSDSELSTSKHSQPSTSKHANSESCQHKESYTLLSNQSKDNGTVSITDYDTRTDASVTLREASLLNLSLSDENLLLGVTEQTSAQSSPLEMSNVSAWNESCCTLVTSQSESKKIDMNKSSNENTETVSMISHESRCGCEKDHECSYLVKTNTPSQSVLKYL